MDESNEDKSLENSEVVDQQAADQDQSKKDRPDINYQAELARKNAELARLRAEVDARNAQPVQRRDPADISTWSDQELKAITNSNDPTVIAYKDQASDLLLERKVSRIREKERVQEKRALSDIEMRSKYPEALDPTSEFSTKMEQVMLDYDLSKTPAGRLAAARIVAAETGKGLSEAEAKRRKNESDRVASVRGQMVDGDRPKPTENPSPKKAEELGKAILFGKLNQKNEAIAEVLKDRGITRDSFFGPKK